MEIETTEITGCLVFSPILRADSRGLFLESFKGSVLEEATGRTFDVRQSNLSVSRAGTIRGLHFARVPPGQAKYVQCVRGAILDVVVDLRIGSPTFGQWEAVRLDDEKHRALFISEGLGHAFCALTTEVTVDYLCSAPYAPDLEFGINPLDPELGIPWPYGGTNVVLSEKDSSAPTLAEAASQGLLPTFKECSDWYKSLEVS